jgi:hypothetical protein
MRMRIVLVSRGDFMLENDILKFQQEIGEIKQDLLNSGLASELDDEESYRLATKIDLTVSRLIRILECKNADA